MNIKPIETVYNGYRFRSRLEARWAVFFDAVGIKYQYEPEGFEVKIGGQETVRYLPDFYLPKFDVYVEVKPSEEKLMQDEEKISWMVDFGGPMANGLLILGQIPVFNDDEFIIPQFNLLKNRKGIEYYLATFANTLSCGTMLFMQRTDICSEAPNLSKDLFTTEDLYLNSKEYARTIDGFIWTSHQDYWTTERSSSFVREAFDKARQARFEHGETPSSIRVQHPEPLTDANNFKKDGAERFPRLGNWKASLRGTLRYEEDIINYLMHDGSMLRDPIPIEPEDFNSSLIGKIFSIIRDRVRQGKSVSMMSLESVLSMEEIAFLARVMDRPIDLSNYRDVILGSIQKIKQKKLEETDVDNDTLMQSLAMQRQKQKPEIGRLFNWEDAL